MYIHLKLSLVKDATIVKRGTKLDPTDTMKELYIASKIGQNTGPMAVMHMQGRVCRFTKFSEWKFIACFSRKCMV